MTKVTLILLCILVTQSPILAKYKLLFDAKQYGYVLTQPHQTLGLLETELRIKVKAPKSALSFSGELRFREFQGLSGLISQSDNSSIADNVGSLSLVELSRFVLTYKQKGIQLKGGKQPIQWGSVSVFSPADVLNSVDFFLISLRNLPVFLIKKSSNSPSFFI